MERLFGDALVPAPLRGAVVAIGNFDGFHIGHQAVVGRALARARAEGRPALVATFDPHPARFFRPDSPPFLLTTISQRFDLFEAFGMDGALALPFDHALAALGPERFMIEWIEGRLGASALVTGKDFTFGKDRAGNTATLAQLARDRGMKADTIAPVEAEGAIASSTRIRDHLKASNPIAAARLLTRPYRIEGIVQHSDKLSRTMGYPPLNIAIGDYQRPAYGIYAVRGCLPGGRVVDGVANLGVRPEFDPPKEMLEPYFFDFSGDLYRQRIGIELISFLRPEAKFDSPEAQMAQIGSDCVEARLILAGIPPAL